MNFYQIKPTSARIVFSLYLILFSITSNAETGVVVHGETEEACSETVMTTQMYDMMSGMMEVSKGACPLVNAKGKEIFGGCKHLSGDGVDWFYDIPEFYSGPNFKTEIQKSCDEWVQAGADWRK
ncbi:hypothetical protein [Alkalimarinus alittae]|uniref:Secreted protein n=1 Tax=Alkalimarinus alittae TaxID=2961619 RepID=A0ABY6N6S1_9ALTE|nr:hypothetical protein [Alkalimarinus alittae]UZE97784.1 hypothetical protein NKI27_08640 [Alkalimarinus alittae]